MPIWITIRTFIAFYLIIFGVAYTFGAQDQRALIGSFLAALGVTFLWRLWFAIRIGN